MDSASVRALLERPYAALEAMKRAHWAREGRARGPEATVSVSWAMWEHIRAVRPGWPAEADRRADLDAHVARKALIDRASHAIARR